MSALALMAWKPLQSTWSASTHSKGTQSALHTQVVTDHNMHQNHLNYVECCLLTVKKLSVRLSITIIDIIGMSCAMTCYSSGYWTDILIFTGLSD